jgi:ribosomal protein S18 acetylase RimI-like enzyme
MAWKIRQVGKNEAERLRVIRLALVKENPKTFGVLYNSERRKPLDYFQKDLEKFSAPDAAIFFLEIDGKIVGMAKVGRYQNKNPFTGYLSSLGILKSYQGQGWGEKLLEYRLKWIKNHTRFKRILMIIVDGNEKMNYLARKYGFSKIDRGSFYGVPNTKYQLQLNYD